ncbi:MAG: hypothetical protein NG747_10785, partial [Candidatus Brocadia sp.]|nr:hypothetical protein [Candidatus Brocadia sp.]
HIQLLLIVIVFCLFDFVFSYPQYSKHGIKCPDLFAGIGQGDAHPTRLTRFTKNRECSRYKLGHDWAAK